MEETEFGGRQKPSQMWKKTHTNYSRLSLPSPKSYPFLLACVVAEDYGQLVPWEHLRTEPEHVTSTQHPHNQHIVSNQLFASGGSLKAWWIFAGAIATHKYRNIKQCPPIFWQLHCNFRRVCAPTPTCHTDRHCRNWALSPAFRLPLVSSPSFLPDHHAALCWLVDWIILRWSIALI